MNQQQLDALTIELCDQNSPHVLVVYYDNIEVHGKTVNYYQSLGLAVSAFYSLLLPEHHDFLKNGHYLAQWLESGEFDQVNDLLIDTIMDDLEDIVELEFTLISIYSLEEYELLIAARSASPAHHGMIAPPLRQTTPVADSSGYAYAYDIARESAALTNPPNAHRLSGDLPSANPVDLEDVVMFDHEVPPSGVPLMANGDYSLMDEDARARLWMPAVAPDAPLFAEATPGPIPASTTTHPAASGENRDLGVSLDARRLFACNFPGCGRRLTRVPDLRRHWRNVHRGHRQT